MKCRIKQKKPQMTKADRMVLKQLERRYFQLRRRMSHEKAMEQMKREAEANDVSGRESSKDNGAVHEAGSDNFEK